MELPNLGKHCTVPHCNQNDFLPLKCLHCEEVFCQPHFNPIPVDPSKSSTPERGHVCPDLPPHLADARAVTCPVCNRIVPTKRGEDPNTRVEAHINAGCPEEATSTAPAYSNVCSFRRCGKKELLPIMCSRCGKKYCISHRSELSHDCKGSAPSSRGSSASGKQPQRSAAAIKAGNAALNRSQPARRSSKVC
ncbi:uncharacterized protein EV422DRAFT_525214 [Fimicolochytrium jonesii]|uniref:uncharacterized protein n=1 Tax=Fimicolochytrium jonesii TaxID=1396493 RepID=UPI0022FE827C|nr:uncharacterized protein EV422DRAFT_525214 [Fimicolochytrium jonesii]KAI8821990.1 hypothetical protein EV422DRAFT_525214 [Fimicolochytrium jonesii]